MTRRYKREPARGIWRRSASSPLRSAGSGIASWPGSRRPGKRGIATREKTASEPSARSSATSSPSPGKGGRPPDGWDFRGSLKNTIPGGSRSSGPIPSPPGELLPVSSPRMGTHGGRELLIIINLFPILAVNLQECSHLAPGRRRESTGIPLACLTVNISGHPGVECGGLSISGSRSWQAGAVRSPRGRFGAGLGQLLSRTKTGFPGS
jgi:hypothetical protein